MTALRNTQKLAQFLQELASRGVPQNVRKNRACSALDTFL